MEIHFLTELTAMRPEGACSAIGRKSLAYLTNALPFGALSLLTSKCLNKEDPVNDYDYR